MLSRVKMEKCNNLFFYEPISKITIISHQLEAFYINLLYISKFLNFVKIGFSNICVAWAVQGKNGKVQ